MLIVTYPGMQSQLLLTEGKKTVTATDTATLVHHGEELLSANLIGSYMVVSNIGGPVTNDTK